MLILTDDKLFSLLSGKLTYQPQPLALAYTPSTAAPVARYGSSEYVRLMEAPNVPCVSIQYLRMPDETYAPLAVGARIGAEKALDASKMVMLRHPEPKIIEYQLDIRAPHDLWLRQIEEQLSKLFSMPYSTTIPVLPFGAGEPSQNFPVRFFFQALDRQTTTQDTTKVRTFRSIWRITAWTWLLAPSSSVQILSRYQQQATVTIQTMNQQTLDTWTIPPPSDE